MDEDGLVRLHGRLDYLKGCHGAPHPILIPSTHQLALLICRQCHHAAGHGGVEHTIAYIRKYYWIPRIRVLLKSKKFKCYLCATKHKIPFSKAHQQRVPSQRLNSSVPWYSTGLDYFGPFELLDKDKAYCLVFVCQRSRAVHLEPVLDRSVSEFILALRRFIAIRGCPAYLRSDNEQSFIRTRTILKEI